MSLTLQDLRVATVEYSKPRGTFSRPGTREATLADLVEILKQEGAYVATRSEIVNRLLVTPVGDPGRYLVLPLGDTPK